MRPRSAAPGPDAKLLAISDLHVSFPENREILESIRPTDPADWLLVAGDVGEIFDQVIWALETLSARFDTVVWAPGNHELWTPPRDRVRLRGERRYRHLVETCRSLGIITPEDPYPVWTGPGGPARIVPTFLLYDFSLLPPGAATKEAALARAYEAGVVCTDEMLLHPDPYGSREEWCRARVAWTEARLTELAADIPLVLVNHYPLAPEPTRILRHPEFAQWCGTRRTADWHRRFNVSAVVYGHLHVPRMTWHDAVRFEEVSLGYPHEWRARGPRPGPPRQVLPFTGAPPGRV